MSLVAKVKTFLSYDYKSTADLSTPQDLYSAFLSDVSFASGTGDNQADLMWRDKARVLAASATEVLDLAGSLSDVYGTTLTFAAVKAILLVAATGNTNNVNMGPDSTNGWLGPFNDASDRVHAVPGGEIKFIHPKGGWAVGAGATDELYLQNSGAGTSVTFDIVIIGDSA